MDKGYDSESIHRFIREELNANSVIPIRSWKNEQVGGIFEERWMNISINSDTTDELWLKPNSPS